MSADGSVVVGVNGTSAFRWDAVNGMVGLPDLPGGGVNAQANGVSDDGSIIVGQGFSSLGTEAFRWDATTGSVGLGVLQSPGESWANAITGDGTVIVGGGTRNLNPPALKWDATGTLSQLPSTGAAIANAVSADGSVVVGAGGSGVGTQAVLWNGIRREILGAFATNSGVLSSSALDVSADGSVVVGTSATTSLATAFVWDRTLGLRRLDVVLASLGVDLTGWTLTSATGISADGQTIVGYGINPVTGANEAWIAVIPEPTTALFLGLGLIGLALRREPIALD